MNCKIRCQISDKSIQSYLMMNPVIAQFYRLNLTFKAQPPYHETIVIGSKAFNSWKRDIWVLMVIVTCLSWWDFGTWWGVTHWSWCLCWQKICPSSYSSDTFEVINIHSLHKHPQTHLVPDLAHAGCLEGDFLNMDTLTCVFQTYHPDFPEVYSDLLHTYNSSRRSVMVVVLGGRVAYYPHPKHPKGRKRCDTEEEKVTMAPRRRHDTPVAPPNPISTIILRSKVKLIKPMKKHRSES